MTITYTLHTPSLQTEPTCVVKTDGTDRVLAIPLSDPSNTDYQEYLAWVAEGNTAKVAD